MEHLPKKKKKVKNCFCGHCVISWHANKLSTSCKNALDKVVKIINFVKSRLLNNRLLKIPCEAMERVHTYIFFLRAEVRWLSRGKILTGIFEVFSDTISN